MKREKITTSASGLTVAPDAIRGGQLSFDVMNADSGRFICTERMPVSPLFRVTTDEIVNWLLRRRPTLKYENIRICFN